MRRLAISASAIFLIVLVLAGFVLRTASAARRAPVQEPTRSATPVSAIQERLAELRYLPWRSVSGRMDTPTRQAIMAFQGWEGLARDGVAGPITLRRLAAAGRPRPLPGNGRRIEIHLGKQVALLVRDGTVVRAIHVSTGRPGLATPTGTFAVFRKQPRSWSYPYHVWLPWASYFTGGVALHGWADVPGYPASHGCVRVPLPFARAVYGFASVGTPVEVVP